MPEIETLDAPTTRPGYFLNLAFATLLAGMSGGALWVSQNVRIDQPLLLQGGSLTAALLALALTIIATKRWSRMHRLYSKTPPRGFRDWLNAKLDTASEALSVKPSDDAGRTVSKTDKPELPAPNRLETERERLRKNGYTDAEISQILIAKETASQTGVGGAGHGVLSGVLSNLAAVITHARNFLPSLKADLAKILDRSLSPLARIEAATALTLKVFVITVLAYAVWLEFGQLKANADRAKAEACIARQKNVINFSTMGELMSGHADSVLDRECKQL